MRRRRAARARSRARRVWSRVPGMAVGGDHVGEAAAQQVHRGLLDCEPVVAEQRADVDLGDGARRRAASAAPRRPPASPAPAARSGWAITAPKPRAASAAQSASELVVEAAERAPRRAASGCRAGPARSGRARRRCSVARVARVELAAGAHAHADAVLARAASASASTRSRDRRDLERPVAVDVGRDDDVADALGGESARVARARRPRPARRRPPPAAGGGADRRMTCGCLPSRADPRCPPRFVAMVVFPTVAGGSSLPARASRLCHRPRDEQPPTRTRDGAPTAGASVRAERSA